MKKISLVLLSAAVAVSGFFSSCTKDDEAAEFNFTGGTGYISTDATVAPDSVMMFGWTITSPTNMKYFTITKEGVALAAWDKKEISSSSENTYVASTSITAPSNTGSYTYEFIALDKNENVIISKSIKITVSTGSTTTEKVLSYSTILMGTTENTAEGSALDAEKGIVYKQTPAKTNASLIDLIYYYNASPNFSSLYSPNALNASVSAYVTGWSTYNATTLAKVSMTAAEFEAIPTTDDSQITAKAVNLTAEKLFALAANDIIAFKTVGGKLGLIKIKAITGTSSGTMEIAVKVQK
jgi:hypothetical protein